MALGWARARAIARVSGHGLMMIMMMLMMMIKMIMMMTVMLMMVITTKRHVSIMNKLTVSKTPYSVKSWHLDDESEYVIDESVQRFICQHTPW